MASATLDHAARGVAPSENKEGTLTKVVESYTSMVPSGTYFTVAMASLGLSAALKLAGRDKDAEFVGHWVPTILLIGIYNKLVKVAGSD